MADAALEAGDPERFPAASRKAAVPVVERVSIHLVRPDGRFRIEGLEPGRHVARATHTDHAEASVDLTLEPDGSRDDDKEKLPASAVRSLVESSPRVSVPSAAQ